MAATLRLVSATLRVRSAMLRARDSSVMAPPDGDAASERTDDAGSLPAAEAGSKPAAGAMTGGTDGAGGGPDIADTKLLGFLALTGCRDERERTGLGYGGGGERTAARWNSRLLEEAGNKSLISLPLFRRGDYIFIVLRLYQ
jgi:hypothetical protein